jgi:hypothetical protein
MLRNIFYRKFDNADATRNSLAWFLIKTKLRMAGNYDALLAGMDRFLNPFRDFEGVVIMSDPQLKSLRAPVYADKLSTQFDGCSWERWLHRRRQGLPSTGQNVSQSLTVGIFRHLVLS